MSGQHDGFARIAARGDGRFDRNLTEQFDADFLRQSASTALTEQCVWLAVVTTEKAHVFDDAGDAQKTASSHVGCTDRDFLC